jgi:cytoskeleton protein RodZ
MTTAEVAQHLKFGVKQIEALEADDYSKLQGNTLVRGMIRSYAKLLQIDPLPLLESHERRQIPAEITVDLRSERIPFPDGVKRSTRMYGLFTLIFLVAVVGIVYEWQLSPGEPASLVFVAPSKSLNEPAPTRPAENSAPAMPVVAAPVPGVEQTATPAAISQEPEVAVTSVKLARAPKAGSLRKIDLEFEKDSWVEIKQGDGRALISQINRGGTRQTLEGTPPFSVVIGNAPAVRLRYNDETVDLRPHFRVDVARLTLE